MTDICRCFCCFVSVLIDPQTATDDGWLFSESDNTTGWIHTGLCPNCRTEDEK